MTYLVDANVLCEPTRPSPSRKVVTWLSAHEANIVVDAIVLGEVCTGILSLSSGRRRTRLEQWFEAVVAAVECLPWDAAIARRWAKLVADSKRRGEVLPLLDSMIAATALEHRLTVVTRNVRDFERAGVTTLNPFT